MAESHEREHPFPGKRTDNFALGGWLDHSYFIVERAQIFFDDPIEGDHLEIFAHSVGCAPGTDPVSGSATWQGVFAGYDLSTAPGTLVEGDAAITMGFAQSTVDVAFTRLGGRSSMTWTALPAVNGVFQDDTLRGQFYGPNHEEAGGVFHRNRIAGALGAARQ
ncbi:transferrin-binding protein-like solute binding protein [Candidatus Saccharibacteria bacterium]|nr:transferrin-binding protein-like solute binding protein [Candidatus Saccharibacteria bacterium]